jgi:hypothetical protein
MLKLCLTIAIALLIGVTCYIHAQSPGDSVRMPIDTTGTDPDVKLDTTKDYVEYPQRLYIGYFQALQRYSLRIAPRIGDAPYSHQYSPGTTNVSGIEVGYDKVFLSFNFRSVRNNVKRTGNNKSINAGFAIGSNKLQFEGLYQYHRGFVDFNSPDYNPSYESPNPYYRKPSFKVNAFRFQTLYYLNHRHLAVKAHQGNNFRQLRSAVSPILLAGFFRTRIKSTDGLVNAEIAESFGNAASIHSFRSVGLTLGGGLAGTFVFAKKLFAGGAALVYLEPQHRRYRYHQMEDFTVTKAPFGGEIRLTTGYNTEKFYFGLWFNSAIHTFNGERLGVNSNLTAAGFSIAFRIKVNKEPMWVQRAKQNRYYKML